MSRDRPVLRAIKLLSLIERHPNGLRVTDMAEQLGAPLRAVYRDPEVLQGLPVPLFSDRNGKESYWKLDPDYRSKLTVPFTLSGDSFSVPGARLSPAAGRNRFLGFVALAL
jgi:predicted DNA-binding transcriptional regulator YafY